MNHILRSALLITLLLPTFTRGVEVTGRFAPAAGKVLVFVGKDNASVGGTDSHTDGYVENVEIPAGISGGTGHMKAYLDSPMLVRCAMHVCITLEPGSEALGGFLKEFTTLVANHPDHPFFIQIGPVFDENFEPETFKRAFRKVVEALRANQLPNMAIIYASSNAAKFGQFEQFDPGLQFYDWIGYSWWGGELDGAHSLDFARKVGKPVFITEACPHEPDIAKKSSNEVWKTWFENFFSHIEKNQDVIRAFSLTLADKMVGGERFTGFETSPDVLNTWRQYMSLPMMINSADKPFSQIGFPAPYQEPVAPPEAMVEPYRDISISVPERIDDLLARMTLEERVAQLVGWGSRDELKLRREGRIFKKEFYAEIAPHGIGALAPVNLTAEEDIRQHQAVQDYFWEETRLAIPALRYCPATHGLMRLEATSFPSPLAISCSWNPELIEKIYSHIGKEARSRGIHLVLGPNADVTGDLRWGQVDETLGHDPFLAGHLGAAMVRGLQGSADGTIAPGQVAATVQHFAGCATTLGGRNRAPFVGGKWALLDREALPFQHIITAAQPAAIMPGYSEIEGLPGHINPWLLQEVLRQEFGFAGLVLGNSQALELIRKDHRIGPDDAAVAAMAFKAGLQLELPNAYGYQHLLNLIEDKIVDPADLDRAVRAVLELKFRAGLFEKSHLSLSAATELASAPETRELAREAARQSMVLLQNDGILPLDKSKLTRIAVIGPNADVCRLGAGSGTPRETVSLLDGVKSCLSDKVEVSFAKGCIFALNDTNDSYLNWRHVNDVNFASVEDNLALINEAAALAAQSDVVILALGENSFLGRETWAENHLGDRSTLDLTASQIKLATQILATGKPIILYLSHGRPITLAVYLRDQFRAILSGHYSGQESGAAAAEVIFGLTNPSGKLTLSWPQLITQTPLRHNQPASAGQFRYIDAPLTPLYPFGHGLCYTVFNYTEPVISANAIKTGEKVDVSFNITNTGTRPGTEIAQLYVSGEDFPVERPHLELKGFARVTLEPGESRKVTIPLHANDLHFYDSDLKRVLPKGRYIIQVGGSSQQLGFPLVLKTGVDVADVDPTLLTQTENITELPKKNEVNEVSVILDMSEKNRRQVIDGFGGSLAFWGTAADDEALQAAINGLNTQIIRVQGEVAPNGDPEHNRDILQRAMKINPNMEVLLTFWQPRSAKDINKDYWLNVVKIDGVDQFEIKREREEEWADEMVTRIRQYRDWGINVRAVGIQNEANWSHPGTQTCRWDPDRLTDFIEDKFMPRLRAKGFGDIKITAPDLAYIGNGASEVDRFIPALTSGAVNIVTYHMYDSYNDQMADKSMAPLVKNSRELSILRTHHFPEKRLWMTETTGAQWNSEQWHTYGWSGEMTEHDKAIKAARYLHTTLVDSEANAFLWWGLVYSLAPDSETRPTHRQKHRDEGLILVAEKQEDGEQKFLERTKKYYTFRQYSGFVKPGYRRIHLESPEPLQISAFLSPDEKIAVAIAINDTSEPCKLKMSDPENMRLIGTFQTDEQKNCSPVDMESALPGKCVRTMVFSK